MHYKSQYMILVIHNFIHFIYMESFTKDVTSKLQKRKEKIGKNKKIYCVKQTLTKIVIEYNKNR